MVDHRPGGPGENGTPVPRDLPDQQADAGEDPWEIAPARADKNTGSDDADDAADVDADGPDMDVPDTDEAGTGRQGAPRAATVNPDHPIPDESTG